MSRLAELADRGPLAASGLAAGLLAGGLALPLFLPVAALFTPVVMVLSAAVMCYVVLRRGLRPSGRTLVTASVMLALLSFAMLGNPIEILLLQLAFWLPALLSAVALLQTANLGLAVLVLAFCGFVTVLAMVMSASSTLEWRQAFAEMVARSTMDGGTPIPPAEREQFVTMLSETVYGAVGVSVMSIALCSVLLARHWQASQVNPGGFRQEFHALQLGRPAALTCAAILAAAFVAGGPLANACAMIAVFAFFVQGLSVCHAVVAQRGLWGGWLVGVYVLLLLPQTILLLAALGIADNFFRLRRI